MLNCPLSEVEVQHLVLFGKKADIRLFVKLQSSKKFYPISCKSRPEKCIFVPKSRPEKCMAIEKSRPEKCQHVYFQRVGK